MKGTVASVRTRRVIQYVEHTEGDGVEMFKAICKLGLEGIVSKKLDAPYRCGPSRTWIKVKNPKAPAATHALLMGRFENWLVCWLCVQLPADIV